MPEKGQNEPGWHFLTGYDRLKAIISEHLENPISVIGHSAGTIHLDMPIQFSTILLTPKKEKGEEKC